MVEMKRRSGKQRFLDWIIPDNKITGSVGDFNNKMIKASREAM